MYTIFSWNSIEPSCAMKTKWRTCTFVWRRQSGCQTRVTLVTRHRKYLSRYDSKMS